MEMRFKENFKNEYASSTTVSCCDGESVLSKATFGTRNSRYCGKYIKTLTVGGVSTEPEHRRSGYVRQMFDKVLPIAPEHGCSVTMLHPFSFAYYRMFGYERVCDHLIVEFPMSKLEYLPRVNDLVKLSGNDRVSDVIKIYEEFASKRNIMFQRFNGAYWPLEPKLSEKTTYIRYHGNEPEGYITLGVEKYFKVNHSASINLNVYEMAYINADALRDLLGFVRMFEGENETVKIHNCAMMPELDLMLRHYTHTSYVTVPDVMARVLDTKAMLEANEYPRAYGHFTVAVEDKLPSVAGVYEVEYQNGNGDVKKVSDSADSFTGKYDLRCTVQAFTQLIYGYYSVTPAMLSYVDGVIESGDTDDFCRAFPKRYAGVFEHF